MLIAHRFIFPQKKSDVYCVQRLIKNNADVNERDNDGWTTLHHVAKSGNVAQCYKTFTFVIYGFS